MSDLEDAIRTDEERRLFPTILRKLTTVGMGTPSFTPQEQIVFDALRSRVPPASGAPKRSGPPGKAPATAKGKVVKKKAGTKAKKTGGTRHRPTPRKDLNRLQRQAKDALDQAGHEPPTRKTKGDRRRSLAYRASHKIKGKHTVLRPATYLTVGLLVGGWKATKWTAVGGSKVARWGSRKVAHKVVRDVRRRKWVPEASRPNGSRWFERVQSLECCGKRFHSAQALNHHLVSAHRGEARQYNRARPKIQRGHTRPTQGKVIVRPDGAGAGRHRARHNIPNARRVDAIIAANRDHFKKIGEAAMALDNAAAALRRAADQLGNSAKPDTPKELTDDCAAMERAFGAWADAVRDWERMLTRQADPGDRRGANIDPALVRPFTNTIREHLDAAGRDFTRMAVAFHEFYFAEIQAARQKRAPNMDMSRTG